MLKLTLTIFLLTSAGYVALCSVMYALQRSMLYFPTPEVHSDEATAFRLVNDGLSLKVWRTAEKSDKALIYFGGNNEDVSTNIRKYRELFPDHTVYLHNYRGYGGSEGKPSEEGLFADALALYDHLAARHDSIDVIGRSLGTGVAVFLASEREVRNLALVTPYDSITSVAVDQYPFLPVRRLLKDRFDSLARATMLYANTLLLIAENDELIPVELSHNLAAALNPEHTRVMTIKGVDHNSICESRTYDQELYNFFTMPTMPLPVEQVDGRQLSLAPRPSHASGHERRQPAAGH